MLWAVILSVKFLAIPHTCFPLFPLKRKGFHKCRVYALEEEMIWELRELQVDKILWDFERDSSHFSQRCVERKLAVRGFRAHTSKEPPYGFVIDF